MSATDRTVTLICLLKLEAPGGNVNLCDGGFCYFTADSTSERYDSEDAIFGALTDAGTFEAGFGDMAESSTIAFVPHTDAALADWYNEDLRDCRLRFWLGKLDADGKTITSAEIMADMLGDTIARTIGADGSQVLELGLIARHEKLFLINEANVASETFHKSVWSGEDGFNNCTDIAVPVAWGVPAPPQGTSGGSTFGSSGGGGRSFGGPSRVAF